MTSAGSGVLNDLYADIPIPSLRGSTPFLLDPDPVQRPGGDELSYS